MADSIAIRGVRRVGRWTLAGVADVGAVSILILGVLRALVPGLRSWRLLVQQMYAIGVGSLGLVFVVSVFTGAVAAVQAAYQFSNVVPLKYLGAVILRSVIIELGPVLTALVVGGRVGASIAAELGTMKVTEQIDALEAVAVDSFKFLAVTRILACIIAMPLLTTIMDFCGIFGGFVAEASISGMSPQLYFNRAFSVIEFTDFIPATLKTAVFGLIIGTVASYLGFNTTQGTEGVGRASTSSVVLASICIILSNVVLVKFIFFMFPAKA